MGKPLAKSQFPERNNQDSQNIYESRFPIPLILCGVGESPAQYQVFIFQFRSPVIEDKQENNPEANSQQACERKKNGIIKCQYTR